jgi:transposase InsO family protein
MTKKNPDKREEKRRFKAKQAEESRRWKAAQMVMEGKSYRAAAAVAERSVAYVQYWAERLLIRTGWRRVDGRRKKRYIFRKGARKLVSDRRRGPPPGNCPKMRAAADKVAETAKEYPQLGCTKIAVISGAGVSGPTALKIMKERKIWNGKTQKKRKFKTFCRENPNDLWQIDHVYLDDDMVLLSVLDDHSRKMLAWTVKDTATTEDVKEILDDAVERNGRPKEILSDHGSQFYAVNGGECEFDNWCLGKEIRHIMGRIGKPTTQGKVERLHRSLRKECVFPPKGSSCEDYTEAVRSYAEFYNTRRPHWGIGFKTPDSAYYR